MCLVLVLLPLYSPVTHHGNSDTLWHDFLSGKDEKALLLHTYLDTPIPPDTHPPSRYACGSSGLRTAPPPPLGNPPPQPYHQPPLCRHHLHKQQLAILWPCPAMSRRTIGQEGGIVVVAHTPRRKVQGCCAQERLIACEVPRPLLLVSLCWAHRLDSFSAESVVGTIRDLAQQQRTVVATVHQPNSEIFDMFGKVPPPPPSLTVCLCGLSPSTLSRKGLRHHSLWVRYRSLCLNIIFYDSGLVYCA